MKGLQLCEILLMIALLVISISSLTYFLGAFSFRLALIVEFTLITAMLIAGFVLFERAFNHP
ncbi:hypothetical protein PCC7418_3488 [Halothece sp. PCC 7418]|uniref:hypothetical protein n=1 Tax=Halothece sp. (strain PCC 7418) TaxID=65093 RepID=UPI0002A07CD5|nr:hypothetical protein [Halothece sp. PCC 7418]AFZ45600.1 hypothetical protein PCC7418_3488 [Halothece sp. PCC 7418]